MAQSAGTMMQSALMEITKRPPVTFVRGHGSWLVDADGKEYLDFVQGWAVNSLGHSHPEMVRVIAQQAATLINASPAFYTDRMVELAAKIVAASGMDRVFFANSGAEANEGAIKLARKWGGLHRNGAYEIITLQNSFHGRSLATMAASGKPQWEALFEPKVPGFIKVPVDDLAAIEQAITDRTVAVMLEPIQGEGGVVPMGAEFLTALRALTRERNILLILDEVQTGVGRTGTMFACQHSGIEPDIMTLGKGLGGGVPLAALTAKQAVCCFEPGDQGGTFNGSALMTAVGSVVFDIISQPDFLAEVVAKGDYLRHGLTVLSQRLGHGEVRGDGLLVGWVLKTDTAADVVQRLFERGLLVNAPRPNVLRFMPALNVTRAEIDQMLTLLAEAVGEPA